MNDNKAVLNWHKYKYYPYEKALAIREINVLLNKPKIKKQKHGLQVSGDFESKRLTNLVYFSESCSQRSNSSTLQARLEKPPSDGRAKKHQVTRYSVHGLHEYKGKFNPQIVRAILNILGTKQTDRILDPFCGSGTTLVECAHTGFKATGFDLNPLAVFITNAKLYALSSNSKTLKNKLSEIISEFDSEFKNPKFHNNHDERSCYLKRWFKPEIFRTIESLHESIKRKGGRYKTVFYAIASNLLREYSLQEPADLRMRVRKTPFPAVSLIYAFKNSVDSFCRQLEAAQLVVGKIPRTNLSHVIDSRAQIKNKKLKNVGSPFTHVITSPPYVTALPYIDTQRLSLVWLNLLEPGQINRLDSELVGSRETNGHDKNHLLENMLENKESIPDRLWKYCLMLNKAVSHKDGFRRKAVPFLLYRYFSDMQKNFEFVGSLTRTNSPYALIIGKNQTMLGGKRFVIDTPSALILLAENSGWEKEEKTSLQTYRRYSIHKRNSVQSEALVILRKK